MGAILILIKAYEIENDARLCGAIIEVLIQFHDPGLVDFFAEALREDHQDIWDPAIDGLMSLASTEALEKLTNALEGDLDKKKREWIEEAVEQFRSQIDERTS